MRRILIAFILLLFASAIYAQNLPSSYYTRVLKGYEYDDIGYRTTEWYLSTNATLMNEYNFMALGWNIDLFNLNIYRGMNRNILDLFRGISIRGTLGFNAMTDYRSKRLAKTTNFSYRVTDVYSSVAPNGQLQFIIRYLNPLNFKITKGFGYNFQFHNYTVRSEFIEWDLSGDPGYEVVKENKAIAEMVHNIQLFDRYALFIPTRGGDRYIEFGAFNNGYFDKPFWQFYMSFGYGF